ncbi:MAG: DUF1223 domain-containing protein [Stellaceae bacterium]
MSRTLPLFIVIGLALGISPAKAGERPVLIELFTSEGCSSCPPADALLAEFSRRRDVLGLSFHVDYWDRLGWKDPFSSPAATQRQQRYADLLGVATVYTPQIVVDGKWQAVGSDRAEIERALGAARQNLPQVAVGLTVDHDRAQISLGSADEGLAAGVVLIGFDRQHVNAVSRGENAGRTLAHVDVVRTLQEAGQFDGRANVIEVPIRLRCDRFVTVVQARDGRVLGVAVRDANPL